MKYQKKRLVPGPRNYASITDYGRKIFVVGDSHLKRINRKKLKNSLDNGKSFIKSFPGTKIQELEHYVTPHLKSRNPDVSILHIGGNNINFKDLSDTNVKELRKVL